MGQSTQMLVAPMALQGAGDDRLIVLAALVTPVGQRLRMALTSQDGADDGEAGHARHVAQ